MLEKLISIYERVITKAAALLFMGYSLLFHLAFGIFFIIVGSIASLVWIGMEHFNSAGHARVYVLLSKFSLTIAFLCALFFFMQIVPVRNLVVRVAVAAAAIVGIPFVAASSYPSDTAFWAALVGVTPFVNSEMGLPSAASKRKISCDLISSSQGLTNKQKAILFASMFAKECPDAQAIAKQGLIYAEKEEVTEDPWRATFLVQLSEISKEGKDYETAVKYAKRAVAVFNEPRRNSESETNQGIPLIGSSFIPTYGLFPVDLASALSNLGDVRSETGQMDEAIAAYTRAIELYKDSHHPEEIRLINLLEKTAVCMHRCGQNGKAQALEREIIKLQDDTDVSPFDPDYKHRFCNAANVNRCTSSGLKLVAAHWAEKLENYEH